MSQLPSELLQQQFRFTPTNDQQALFERLDDFVLDRQTARKTFVLRGFAGTGKTSVIGALIKVLRMHEQKTLMLAPTGRAAKVMSSYSRRMAFTIHKIVFKLTEDAQGQQRFVRQKNAYKQTVFIVDEASMIDDNHEYGQKGLLTELIQFVFDDPASGNKLLLVGDVAQLPPVGQRLSPALNDGYLRQHFDLPLRSFQLTEVVRQEALSGILYNATSVRESLEEAEHPLPQLVTKGYKDVYRMNAERLEDGLHYAYQKFGAENTILACRTNRNATHYNRYIRHKILFREEELEAGDLIMVVRNNYFWLGPDSPAGFLANGEFAEVLSMRNVEEVHGLRFADLRLRLLDYPDHPTVEAKVILDTLHSYTPNMSYQENRELFEKVMADYADVEDSKQRMQQVRQDPYLNALQIKFAYALTCHKAQGGQWDAVFVDMGFVPPEQRDQEFLRWLYTAVTRAKSELFLMNFEDSFYANGSD